MSLARVMNHYGEERQPVRVKTTRVGARAKDRASGPSHPALLTFMGSLFFRSTLDSPGGKDILVHRLV
jgi:hypothetical protein